MKNLRTTRSCLIAAFTIAALLSTAALAQAPAMPPHPSPAALTTPKVGSASVPVANPNPHRTGLYVSNPGATVTLWVSPTGTPAAVNGAGSIAIQPLQGVMFGPPNMPAWTNGMSAIAPPGASNSISILEYQ
jgi:hypothetical protein